ncbi:MAG: insulinase family protein [Eubacteriaceae bacterium]|jgi:Zn-dependent M16 (insulinase) family peptidase
MTNHGFREISREHSDILDAELIQLEHEKSGARLAAVLTDDSNKVFQIGFRTPSDNSTGVAHIMEHSVLCGSRKYPVREPFVELAKGSINTFLNAMTYPDKTVYPIASTNNTDFRNLEDVYLDAVFYPDITKNPYTLMQEGWHYHLEKPEDELTYNGVVYNEMKGVFSNPEEVLDRQVYNLLFPDTIYGEESGGDPDHIPELTYENFVKFHDTYYHPANSWIYLYGDIDLDEQLAYLDSWLSAFDRIEPDSEIAVQAPFEGLRRAQFPYPVTEKSEDDEDYLSLNWVLPARPTLYENLMFQILSYALLNSNAAPLKKALLQSGIARDISYSLSTPMLQPVMTVELKNTRAGRADEFLQIVRNTLTELADHGFDPEDAEAAVNITEFKTLEVLGGETGTAPKGLLLGLEMMESWLYSDKAFDRLGYEGLFDKIRADVRSGALQQMIQKHLLDNPHQGLVALVPDADMAEAHEQQLAEKLAQYKATLDDTEISHLVDETNELLRRQSTPDSAEALATIPRLSVNEIDRKAVTPDWIEKKAEGITLLEHPEATKGLVYLEFFFDAEYVPSVNIPMLSLLNKVTGRIGTEALTYEELLRETDLYTGGISTSVETNEDVNGEVVASFILHGKSTKDRVAEVLRLAGEMLLHPSFEESDQIKSIISETKLAKQQQIQSAGHAVAVQRLSAGYSESARLFEEIGGIAFFDWISKMDKEYEVEQEEIADGLMQTMLQVVNRNGLTISITAEPEDMETVEKQVLEFASMIPEAETRKRKHSFGPLPKNEAFMTAGSVQYNAQGGSFKDIAEYSGSMLVAKTILSMDYLWNRVRVKGGAYGAGFGMSRNGDLYMNSFRDPNLAATYEAFAGVPDYLEQLELPQAELDKYVIGTISPKETPLSPSMKATLANTMHFTGITAEDRQREREQILDVTGEDLNALGKTVRTVLEQDRICTIGSQTAVQADQKETKRFGGVRNVG